MSLYSRSGAWPEERRIRHAIACDGHLSLAERLMEHCIPTSTGCLEWQGCLNSAGYGTIGIGSRTDGTRKTMLVHRLSYILFVGLLSNDLSVLHHCDNPPCLRPEHLFKGTIAENVLDMMRKGRHNTLRGSQLGTSILTEEKVRKIKSLLVSHTTAQLARMFKVSDTLIANIRYGRSWKHV